MNVTQVLAGQSPTITLTAYTDGTATDQGTFTIGIVDANGTAVVAAGTSVTDNDDGTYDYTLAAQTDPARLIATWTESGGLTYRTFIEVTRNALFTEAQARGVTYTGLQTPLSDSDDYPDEDIARVRQLITEQFENRTGRAMIRRYTRAEIVCAPSSCVLSLMGAHHRDYLGNALGGPGADYPARIIAATTNDGNAVDTDDITIDSHRLILDQGSWMGKTVVEYEYGPDPVSWEANEHALRMAVANLVPSDVSGYAQTFQGQDGIVNYGGNLAWPATVWNWLKSNPRPPFVL